MNLVILPIFLFILPISAFAEVADKVPSLTTNIIISLIACLGSLLLIKWRWWLLPIGLCAVCLAHSPIIGEIYSEIGPYLLQELGPFYVFQPQVSLGISIGMSVTYSIHRKIHQK